MARTRTLGDMRTDVLRLADLENAVNPLAPRFTPSEINEYINKGLAHVYAEMITVMDRPFFSSEAIITLTNFNNPLTGPTVYPLPADFLQILSVGWNSNTVGGGPWTPLDPGEEAEYMALTNTGYFGGTGPKRYFITGGPTAFTQGTIATAYGITILPPPTTGSILKIRYVPTCPRLVNDNDTFDGLLGFEDAAIVWAAILMRRKDDLDTSDLEKDMAKHFSRIDNIAKRRDRSRPPRIQQVRNRFGWTPRRRGGGWGNGGAW